MGKYDDIVSLSRPLSKNHPPMSMEKRAAQFSPFAALTGYDDAVAEEGRLTEEWRELSEEDEGALNEALQYIILHQKEQPTVRAEYFVPDAKKDGGTYAVKEGSVRYVDPASGYIEFSDRTRIEIKYLTKIEQQNNITAG